jgi:hypothetical protein
LTEEYNLANVGAIDAGSNPSSPHASKLERLAAQRQDFSPFLEEVSSLLKF